MRNAKTFPSQIFFLPSKAKATLLISLVIQIYPPYNKNKSFLSPINIFLVKVSQEFGLPLFALQGSCRPDLLSCLLPQWLKCWMLFQFLQKAKSDNDNNLKYNPIKKQTNLSMGVASKSNRKARRNTFIFSPLEWKMF